MEVIVKTYAKINLALDIKNKRDDGYHNVEMVMQSVDLYDLVIITTTDNKNITINVNKDLDVNHKENTAYKAAQIFFEYSKIENPGLEISIKKNIPVAAGLAGGSSDAAGVLVGLNHLFKTNYTPEVLASLGAKIGADVPFCIYGGTMLATGIGTELKKVAPSPECYIVLAKPNLSVSTQKAYKLSDNAKFTGNFSVNSVIDALNSGDICKLSKTLFNRFSQVLDLDDVHYIENTANKYNALASCMSGSGPSVFSLFLIKEDAQACAEELKKKYNEVFICFPVSQGYEII